MPISCQGGNDVQTGNGRDVKDLALSLVERIGLDQWGASLQVVRVQPSVLDVVLGANETWNDV